MKTGMERAKTLEAVKKGIMPKELKDNYPDEAEMIIKMLYPNPQERIAAEELITNHIFSVYLISPMSISSKQNSSSPKTPKHSNKSLGEKSGWFHVKSENSEDWCIRWVKVCNDKLLIFRNKNDKKAI
jgi:hypothetical protein